MKIALIIACIGHIICGITDCMMAYMKNGRFEFSDVKDNKKMQKVFEGASLKQLELVMLIGVFALYITIIDKAKATLAPSAVASATYTIRVSVHPPEGMHYRNCGVISW